MAKSPKKNPPKAKNEAEGNEASVPSIENTESSAVVSGSEAAPTLVPPASSTGSIDDTFGAGTWNNDKRVNALFSTNETRNSWMGIVGIGWVKLANNIDSANEALNVLATAAKVKNSPINYLLDNDKVTQIYVW